GPGQSGGANRCHHSSGHARRSGTLSGGGYGRLPQQAHQAGHALPYLVRHGAHRYNEERHQRYINYRSSKFRQAFTIISAIFRRANIFVPGFILPCFPVAEALRFYPCTPPSSTSTTLQTALTASSSASSGSALSS